MRFLYNVITLTPEKFDEAARELDRRLGAEFKADVYIGIKTGGFILAESMVKQSDKKIPLLPVTCRRSSTAKKEQSGLFKTIISKLPYCITNMLRIAEHIYLTQKSPPQRRDSFVHIPEEFSAIEDFLNGRESTKILLIDDSVDSGATLEVVARTLQNLPYKDISIRTAAITVTTQNPLKEPDFVLYRHTLCRCPWSFDYKR